MRLPLRGERSWTGCDWVSIDRSVWYFAAESERERSLAWRPPIEPTRAAAETPRMKIVKAETILLAIPFESGGLAPWGWGGSPANTFDVLLLDQA
jgi:hypothetical protein